MRNRVAAAGASAAAIDDDDYEEGGDSRLSRILSPIRRHPMDSAGLAILFALALLALTNALFLQSGKHPAPIRAIAAISAPAQDTTGALLAAPATKPQTLTPPKQVDPFARPDAEVIADIQKELARKGFYEGAIDGLYGPRIEAAIRSFEQAAGLKPSSAPSEDLFVVIVQSRVKADRKASGKTLQAHASVRNDASNGTSSPRMMAVQRALTEFGYGQIKATGAYDAATKAAIEKFERDRKLPVSGKLSDRLLRELAAVTGRPIE